MTNAKITFGKELDENNMVQVTVTGYEPVRPVFDLIDPTKKDIDFSFRTNKPTDTELQNIEKAVWSCYNDGFEENSYYLDYGQALYMAWCVIQKDEAEASELWLQQSRETEEVA